MQVKPGPQQELDPKIAAEYARRRVRLRWAAVVGVVAALAGFLFPFWLAPQFFFTLTVLVGIALMLASLSVMQVYWHKIWRCPACERRLGGDSQDCPHCGIRLR